MCDGECYGDGLGAGGARCGLCLVLGEESLGARGAAVCGGGDDDGLRRDAGGECGEATAEQAGTAGPREVLGAQLGGEGLAGPARGAQLAQFITVAQR